MGKEQVAKWLSESDNQKWFNKKPNLKREYSFDELEEPIQYILRICENIIFRGEDYDKWKTRQQIEDSGRGPMDPGESGKIGEQRIMVYYHVLSETDATRGFFYLSKNHLVRTSLTKGSNVRQWVEVETFAKMFFNVLKSSEGMRDADRFMLMLEYSDKHDLYYSNFFRSWVENESVKI